MADDYLEKAIDKVGDVIDNAISSNDYTDLSRQIGSLMRDVVDAAGAAVKNAYGDSTKSEGQKAARAASERLARERAEAKKAAQARAAKEKEEEQYFAKAEDAAGPKIVSVLGAAGTVLFGLATILMTLFSQLQMSVVSDVSGVFAVMAGILTACSIAMLVGGRRASRRAVRFKSYRSLIMPKLYADVSDLSREMQLPEKEVVSDLEGYMKSGKIKQGHFDDTKTCFIASDQLYQQYRDTVTRAEVKRQQEAAEAAKQSAYSPEVREILSKGSEYINMIHRANDEIPDEEISDKLDRMETIVRRIFDEVRQRPELAGKLNMFMNYYLPTTTKLMNAYVEMDRQEVQGSNIKKAKQEISDSLDTINDAFETLLDSFFSEQTRDVSSDINVMKMMMKQEGLTPDEMAAMRKKQAQQAQTASSSHSSAFGAGHGAAAQAQAVPEEK